MEEPRRLGGRYELGAVLGTGGMAEVHIGHDIRLGRTVAVKTLRADLARDPVFQARFRREAQSAASLNHPSIVAVYDTGEDYIDGVSLPYIVMEYVDGSTLRDLLHSGRRLLPERAMEMTSGILSGLEYSHRNGIVHRDIKPANVMLTRNGTVKVMDFGIARAMADTGGITMTQTSSVIGTAQYLSPEQARGETVDARSDLYSTACLLFELLTLRPPFVGDTPVSVAYQHVREEPQPPSAFDPEVTPVMDAIVLKGLAKSPDDRYQSADEFRADIERALDGLPVEAQAGYAAGGYGETAPTQQYQGATQMMPPPGGGTQMMPPVDDDGYTEDGGRASRRQQQKKGRTSTVLLILAALLVIVGAYLVGKNYLSGGSDTPENQLKSPSLTGQTLPEARRLAAGDGLKLTEGEGRYCGRAKGQICAQDPAAGRTVKKGDTITVYPSKGAKPVAMPAVVGQTYDDAVQLLVAKGFDQGNIKQKAKTDDSETPGKVLAVNPPEGSQVPRNAQIVLTVAQKPAAKAVPDVTGQTQDSAQQVLQKAGFTASFKNADANDPSRPEGTVVQQQPGANAQAQPGSTVTVVLNPPAGQQPPASPTPTDSQGQGDGGNDHGRGNNFIPGFPGGNG